MKLSDAQKRLTAPFHSHLICWTPQTLNDEGTSALLMPRVSARSVMDRLDAICPDDWEFRITVIPTEHAPSATVQGVLTVLGITRSDIGIAKASKGHKAATSDALKRCAVQFGIGRYLEDVPPVWADWDAAKREAALTPKLPDWALPSHERTAGGAHLVGAMEQLRYELPEDVEAQREVYKHLKAALSSLHPVSPGHDAS